MQKNQMLKVCGILMIIGGSLGILINIIAVVGVGAVAALAAYAGAGVIVGLLTFACILMLAGSVMELVTGILGVKTCDKPEKVKSCITCCIIVIALSLLGTVLTIISGGSVNFFSLLLSLVLPVLYLIGAFQLKKAI